MKYFVLASLLFASSITSANQSAEVVQFDWTGRVLNNMCATADPVMVTSGILHIVVRRDSLSDVNGFHILSKAAGSFPAVGLSTGDEYLANVSAPTTFLPASNQNFANGPGMTTFIANVEIINLSNPGSGVSKLHIVIVAVFSSEGSGENKVLEVSMECVGQ